MFCKLTGDLPEAMDKGWQGWTALLWSLIKERSKALLRYSLWDAAIWEKSGLPIIRENNFSWPQHCQGRNYLLTQWHWLRLLATFVNFGAVTQGLPSAIVLFICIMEFCPQTRTPLFQKIYKCTTNRKSQCMQTQGQIPTHYLLPSTASVLYPMTASTCFLPVSYMQPKVTRSCCMQLY